MPRTQQQYESIRREKRVVIKQAALELFSSEGFHATSISRIAERAGISKGLLYNYYESKEELLKDIISEAAEKIYVHLDPDHDGQLSEEEFFYFIRQNWKVIAENAEYYKLYTAMVLQPSVLSVIEHSFDELSRKTSLLLLEFFRQKGFDKPEEELLMFSFILKGAVLQVISYPHLFNISKIETLIIDHYKEKFKNIKP